jgi:hypothetical protein
MTDPDWWAPLGAPGELRVKELVDDEPLRNRALATENVEEITLAEFSLGGRPLIAEVGHRAYSLRDGADVLVRLTPPTAKGQPWAVELAGEQLAATYEYVDLQTDAESKVDQVYYLLFRAPGRSWVMHFTGGRLAGETLVLSRGDIPRTAPAVLRCVPASQSRQVPRPRLRRRQPADTHVTSWTGEASPAEIALAQMVLLAGLHSGVDYLAAGLVGAAREIAGIWRVFTPVPDPLPTKTEE